MDVHDAAAAFLAFWDAAGGLDADRRTARFRSDVVPAFPDFYEHRFATWRARGLDPDAELARELDRTAGFVPAIRQSRDRIVATIARDLAEFRRALPDFRDDVGVHLCHSLGECDGGIRVLRGRPTFLLGLDVIARLHDTPTEKVFLHHELFHLYHGQWFVPGREPGFPPHVVHTSLWMEGLATWASHVMNPNASPRDLLIDTPPGSFAACEARRAELAAALLADLRSQEQATYARWFLLAGATPGQPARAGYHLGLAALRAIGSRRPLPELARLTERTFVPLLEEALSALRDGGSDGGRP